MNPSSPFAVVVNDDSTQLSLLSGLLRKAGLESRVFTRAEAALTALSSGTDAIPALIVTDLYMPGIDGWQFCRLLRSPEYAALNQVSILVVSATFSGEQSSRIAADLGAEAFLPFPVDGDRFCEQVQAILIGKHVRNALRVLIVDDNADLCEVLKEVFANHGYHAETVFTAQAAVEAFEKIAYDVAVLDYHLPDRLGDALLVKFRAMRPDCVCLMMTSDPGPELALDWMKKGAAAYLQKPFQSDYLIELCARARRERALLRVQDQLDLRTCELRESKEAALKNNALLRSIMESPQDVLIFALDTSYRYTTFTQAHKKSMKRIWGVEIEVGMNMLEVISNPIDREKARRHFDSALQGKCFIQIEEYGDPLLYRTIYEDRYAPIHGDGGVVSGLTVFVVDITERRRAEEEKSKLEVQLRQAHKMESVGRLAGGIAHDFNNMIHAILGNVYLAMEEIPPGSPARQSLDEISNCAQRSADLTRQLLAFARQQAIAPKVLDLNKTVEGLLKLLRRLIGEDIHLVWCPASSLWPVKLDPTQMDQILANLCVNARDAINGVGKITIKTERAVFDEAYRAKNPGFVPGEYLLLAVSDDGCGMDKETLSQIFEPFFTTKSPGKGTGLGLATVYGIVKQNNGFIHVDSDLGKGTTFNIYLPRHAEEAAPTQEEIVTKLPKSSGETVLVVEDEPAILTITLRVLEQLGYSTLIASTPHEAIRLAETHGREIHLLLTDVVMPEMNGRDLARRLLTIHPKLKCLFMSGYTADIIAHRGVLEPGLHFIQKPFLKKDLAVKIREALEQ